MHFLKKLIQMVSCGGVFGNLSFNIPLDFYVALWQPKR